MLKDNGPGFEVGCKTGKDIQLSKKIKGTKKTTLLSISHDIYIVRYLSDRVIVMYLGHVVELGSTDQIFSPPYHPYTEAILSAVPIADTNVEKKHIFLEGDIPSAMSPSIAALFKSAVNGKKCSTRFMQKKCHLNDI